ncbi:hypothetical protein BDN70DRAFT_929338 [Pholiota conissans]|uniref:Heterokaryon incompatibility domain-containing protein n=1 Tax=Pholiota conissans TaxID=109636 RepID=A0A9P5Z9J0_9AGAR|nr:hypothetical protein BDN70DRAFT_929338 [Pholiota conissans]
MPPATNGNTRAETSPDVRPNDQGFGGQSPSNIKAQAVLLTALRNFIVPLIQMAVPESEGKIGINDAPIGCEAEELLSALQIYITSIIRGGTKAMVVDFEEMSEMRSKAVTNDGAGLHQASFEKGLPSARFLEAGVVSKCNDKSKTKNIEEERVIFQSGRDCKHYGEPYTLAQVLNKLREHVFNNMPIRLLSFRKCNSDDSKLAITLCDRAGVYSYFEQKIIRTDVKINGTYLEYVVPIQLGKTCLSLNDCIAGFCEYAILSHTWLCSSPEVTYDDWLNVNLNPSNEGYRKLINFCRAAEENHGVTLGWMDTICIDKSSSSELDESIRSMYKWYQNAKICIAYLADTTSIVDMDQDRWFTRGWTLQELLAPNYLKFYGCDWKMLVESDHNDKDDPTIAARISAATGIYASDLRYHTYGSISSKMRWAAKRQVTRSEDIAYSLMGLFGVNMSIAYGEGAECAFFRLIKEILSNNTSSYMALDIFNFGGDPPGDEMVSQLLPVNPQAYLHHSYEWRFMGELMEPLLLTHLGLRIPVLLLPATPKRPDRERIFFGDYFTRPASVCIEPMSSIEPSIYFDVLHVASNNQFEYYNLSGGICSSGSMRCAFAVLNCTSASDDEELCIPVHCLAVPFIHTKESGKVTSTTHMFRLPAKDPVTFEMCKKAIPEPEKEIEFYTLLRSELARHGMQFLTMYL